MDHEIFGEVSLYGMPAADGLGQDDHKIFSAMLHEPTITFAKSGGLLQMRGNQLTSLTAGEDMVRAIKKLRLTKKGELQEVYRAAFVSDNWLRTRTQPFTTLVAERVAFTSNSYEADNGQDASTVIVVGATYTGNQALNSDVVLRDISQFNKDNGNKVANVGIRVVGF